MKMNRETYVYAYGFIAGVLLAAFVSVLAYAVCNYHCGKMLDELLSRGTVIVVPDRTIQNGTVRTQRFSTVLRCEKCGQDRRAESLIVN